MGWNEDWCSLTSIPSKQFKPLEALFYCTYSPLGMVRQGPTPGFYKKMSFCSSEEDPHVFGFSKYKYYDLHLSKELFPEVVGYLEVVKTDCFSLMHPDFNVWKKVGNSSSTVLPGIQQ